MKLLFIKNHSPRKKGDVVDFETRDEKKIAQWYVSNQIAEVHDCKSKGTGCAECNKKAKSQEVESKKVEESTEDNASTEETEKVSTRKTTTKKK